MRAAIIYFHANQFAMASVFVNVKLLCYGKINDFVIALLFFKVMVVTRRR